MTVETIAPVAAERIARPKGRYTVELFDAESGVLVETRQLDNYISPLYELAMAGLQYNQQWFRAGLANNSVVYFPESSMSTGVTTNWLGGFLKNLRLWNPMASPALPQDALIITDDDSAEDTDETWLRGNLVAFASRWKATVAASGQRGLINEGECTITNNGATHKTVWDFTTQQGNGTFQTLAIGSMVDHDNTTKAAYWTAAGPVSIVMDERMPYLGSSNPYGCASNVWSDGTTLYWLASDTNSTVGNLRVYSSPIADVFGAAAHASEPFALDAGTAAPTMVCDTGIDTAGTPSSNSSTPNPLVSHRLGLCRIGTTGDFVMVYTGHNSGSSASAQGRNVTIRRFTSAGSLVWSTTPLTVSTVNINGGAGVVYDGTNLFVCGSPGDDTMAGNIYRIDPATGALSATIALPAGVLVDNTFGMAWDGTNILLGTNVGIIKLDTTGVPVSPYNYGMPLQIRDTSTAVAPWTTTAGDYGSIGRRGTGVTPVRIGIDEGFQTFPDFTTSAGVFGEMNQFTRASDPSAASLAVRGMTVHNGKLWLLTCFSCHPDFAPSGACAFIGVTGANMQSRAVLDSPVTKTSSQNMKITYELTWPLADLTTYPEHRDL